MDGRTDDYPWQKLTWPMARWAKNSMDHGARRLKYKCVEITECKLYMRVDDTKITRGTIQCLWHEEYRIQNARPCVEKMQLIFFVPPNEELEGTLHPQKFGCAPKNEVKGYMCPQIKKTCGHAECCIEYTSSWAGFQLTILVVICTDCTCSCKSNFL